MHLIIVPDKPIEGLQLQATQPTKIYIEWKTFKEVDFHGHPLGYVIRYKGYGEDAFKEKLVEYGSISETIEGLQPYTIHVIEMMAYTNAGRGPPVANTTMTLEGRKYFIIPHLCW